MSPLRPERAGTVLGEGAAVLVLEELGAARPGGRASAPSSRARERVRRPRGHDAPPAGRGLAQALEAALGTPARAAEAIGYVAAHGSGTRLGDRSEARALRTVFGSYADRVVGSSVKAATGHLMAAAGALNVAVAALALEHQRVPPTLNLDRVDPDCSPRTGCRGRRASCASIRRSPWPAGWGGRASRWRCARCPLEREEPLMTAKAKEPVRVVVTGVGAVTGQGNTWTPSGTG